VEPLILKWRMKHVLLLSLFCYLEAFSAETSPAAAYRVYEFGIDAMIYYIDHSQLLLQGFDYPLGKETVEKDCMRPSDTPTHIIGYIEINQILDLSIPKIGRQLGQEI